MSRRFGFGISLLIIMSNLSILSSCSQTQNSFLTIQTCVINDNGIQNLFAMMNSVSKQFGLRYVDGSKITRDGLIDTAHSYRDISEAAHVINLSLEGDAGLGLTAGNLGLAPHQIAIGFTAGQNPAFANQLAKSVIIRMSKNWQVTSVPKGTGVQRMTGCS